MFHLWVGKFIRILTLILDIRLFVFVNQHTWLFLQYSFPESIFKNDMFTNSLRLRQKSNIYVENSFEKKSIPISFESMHCLRFAKSTWKMIIIYVTWGSWSIIIPWCQLTQTNVHIKLTIDPNTLASYTQRMKFSL